MEQHWEGLLRQSFIGLDRKPNMDPEILAYLKTMFQHPDQELPIKDQIALLSTLRKVNPQLEQLADLQFELPEPEERKAASGLVEIAKKIGFKRFLPFLPEILEQLRKAKQLIPPYFLPEMLQLALDKPGLYVQYQSVLGEKGDWLIHLNEDWQALRLQDYLDRIKQLDTLDWKSESKHVKEALFPILLTEKPVEGWGLFQGYWESATLPIKKQLLKVLDGGVQLEHQDFLENQLDQQSIELRRLAAGLLAELPETGWSHRVQNRLQQWVHLKGSLAVKAKLEFKLPERLDPGIARDGWIEKGKSLQLPAEQLIQSIFSLIPPNYWSEQFDVEPELFCKIVERSDDAIPIFSGLLVASIRYRKLDWQLVIGQFFVRNRKKIRWQNLPIGKFFSQMEALSFQGTMECFLQENKGLVEPNEPIVEALLRRKAAWSPKMTIVLIQSLCDWLSSSVGRYWEAWHYRGILKQAAHWAPANLEPEIQKMWPRNARVWGNWEKEVDEFQAILKIRAEIQKIIFQ
ncbi:MAG: DUF5691 domain-containing protein [Bacteroidota bacterium]